MTSAVARNTNPVRRAGVFDGAREPLLFAPVQRDIGGATTHFTVALFGKKWGDLNVVNWSLAPFQKATDTAKDARRAARICEALSMLGTGTYYAPVPIDFNGLIAEQDAFTDRIDFDKGIYLLRGPHADAALVPRGTGFALSTGGCPLFVATDGRELYAAHAGLRSLIRTDGTHTSVVTRIAERFAPARKRLVQTWVFFSIRPEHYLHSLDDKNEAYRANNMKIHAALEQQDCKDAITAQGGIDLATIVRKQCAQAGIAVPTRNELTCLPSGAYTTRLPGMESTHRNLAGLFFHGIK